VEIKTESELEELLSRPDAETASAIAALDGDLLILGAGGKMGPSLARLARRAADEAGVKKRVVAVARFTNRDLCSDLAALGIETISADLLDPGTFDRLPEIPNVIFMAARKFGTAGGEHLTWAMNTYLPGLVAERYRNSRIVAFSTGNVYPLRSLAEGGAIESTPVAPVGEYAQSALGRERMFEYGSMQWHTPVTILRLNYAVELRYGVLVDIGRSVFEHRPIDLCMPYVNVIWQRDANAWCLRSFAHCSSPPTVLNISGPETLSVKELALEFGRHFGIDPIFVSDKERSSALLSDISRAAQLFGTPTVRPTEMIDWIAKWIRAGGAMLNKPTHFQTRDGQF
jgi:NAD dependent epimerase/dehydratase family